MQKYNPMIPGPPIERPFVVVKGIAVIRTIINGFPVPQGGAWPGHQLPLELLNAIQATDVELFPGTVLRQAMSEHEIQSGVVLVRVALMLTGTVVERLAQVPDELIAECNQTTLASALSKSRETISNALNARKRQ